jgi:phenylalanyl-tRNA synthetase beta chain
MKVPYNWLKSYIDFPYSPEELAHVLTMAGMEVDEVEYLGEGLEEIVIGEISEIKEHPNADKLVICMVNTGKEELQIVTGAPNVVEGAKVPVAGVGVTLPNGMEIKKAKLRGVTSYGMLCSTDELGLSEERASGIMILDDQAEVGRKLLDYLGLDEYVLNLDLTPNYARALGLIGIARELKAILEDKEVDYPEIDIKEGPGDINEMVAVEVKDPDLCPRYTGRVIKNVKIGPSPLWMQRRLKAAGIRPINNVVDITNYVLLEYNQPLHAFDYDKIGDKKVIVRKANEGETMVTLDDKERQLDEEILLIADPQGPIGLAGVMGGANSEVTEGTNTIFLEAAYFNPVNIRKTAKKLGLPSEASHRFERGIDIENVLEASNRAAYLMQEYAGGEVVSGIIDIYPEPFQRKKIELDVKMVNELLGIELTEEEIMKMLSRLEFEVRASNEANLEVTVPGYRNDVEREADLIEEVARIYGYNNIPVTSPESKQQGGRTARQGIEDLSKDYMLSAGLDEVITFSLTGEDKYEILNLPADSELKNWVRIKNPLSESYAVMRTSLLPGILEVLTINSRRQVEKMAIFELGNVYFNTRVDGDYLQQMKLAGGSMGYEEDSWNTGAPDFFYLKGILEGFFRRTGIRGYTFEPARRPYLHPGRTACIVIKGQEVGILGEVLPQVIEELDLVPRTTVFQLDFQELCKQMELTNKFIPLPKHPAVERDLAIVVNKRVKAGDVLNLIKDNATELLKKVELFDLYEGDQIPAGSKSLAFKLLFQAENRTLRDEEVNKLFEKLLQVLEKKYGAKIRGI